MQPPAPDFGECLTRLQPSWGYKAHPAISPPVMSALADCCDLVQCGQAARLPGCQLVADRARYVVVVLCRGDRQEMMACVPGFQKAWRSWLAGRWLAKRTGDFLTSLYTVQPTSAVCWRALAGLTGLPLARVVSQRNSATTHPSVPLLSQCSPTWLGCRVVPCPALPCVALRTAATSLFGCPWLLGPSKLFVLGDGHCSETGVSVGLSSDLLGGTWIKVQAEMQS